jgi:hypothetical protein
LIPKDYNGSPSCGFDIALIGITFKELLKINQFIRKLGLKEHFAYNKPYFEATDYKILLD